jgi:integrase
VGTVFKKQVTRPLPLGAEIIVRKGERLARWTDSRGKTRTAPVTTGKDGTDRLVTESPYYVAQYRDGAGHLQVVSTGCRDERAARKALADLEKTAELIRRGVITAAEASVGEQRDVPLSEHLDDYLAHLEASGRCPFHRSERRRQLDRLATECGFTKLADFNRGTLEQWLVAQAHKGMGPRTRNSYVTSAVAFCNWCCSPGNHRLAVNPFARMPKANEKADLRRQRRAMTEDELTRLLAVAAERPLVDALTVRKGERKGERYAKVRPAVRDRLLVLGRERALICKTLVLTGLRKGELASLTVAHLRLDDAVPHAILDAADEKNREGSEIPIRDDLAGDLREWLADRLRRLQSEARSNDGPIPARLPPDAPLFTVPAGLIRILDRDLARAGIPKMDERGRTLDVHALRHTFGTLMSKGGVAPRTAQAAMRHSKIDLTMNVYTDPRLLDVRGALDALPTLPLAGPDRIRATGTAGAVAQLVAQALCNRVYSCQNGRRNGSQWTG